MKLQSITDVKGLQYSFSLTGTARNAVPISTKEVLKFVSYYQYLITMEKVFNTSLMPLEVRASPFLIFFHPSYPILATYILVQTPSFNNDNLKPVKLQLVVALEIQDKTVLIYKTRMRSVSRVLANLQQRVEVAQEKILQLDVHKITIKRSSCRNYT